MKIEVETTLYSLHEFQRKVAEAAPQLLFVRPGGSTVVGKGAGGQGVCEVVLVGKFMLNY